MANHPLHDAVLKSDTELVMLLISQGTNLDDLDDEHGNSPLHWAVMRGDKDTVLLLLDAGANPNVICTDGYTPAWSAADWGLSEIGDLLRSRGGKVSTDDQFDRKSWSVFKDLLNRCLKKTSKQWVTNHGMQSYAHSCCGMQEVSCLHSCRNSKLAQLVQSVVR